jgi:hypothetical protein
MGQIQRIQISSLSTLARIDASPDVVGSETEHPKTDECALLLNFTTQLQSGCGFVANNRIRICYEILNVIYFSI